MVVGVVVAFCTSQSVVREGDGRWSMMYSAATNYSSTIQILYIKVLTNIDVKAYNENYNNNIMFLVHYFSFLLIMYNFMGMTSHYA